MKLEEGMYVRTKKGSIGKILGIDYRIDGNGNDLENIEGLYFDNCIDDIGKDIYSLCFYIFKDAKTSHNIIDLIKHKDIILGKDGKLYQCWKLYKDYVFTYSKNKQGQTITLVDYQIDKVLCYEQFESMSYKVGE